MGVMLWIAACTPEPAESSPVDDAVDDTAADDTAVKPPEIILGDPYVGIVSAIGVNGLDDGCQVSLKVTTAADTQEVADLSMSTRGMDWTGVGLTGGVQYKAVGSARDCSGLGDEDSFESGTFSGEKGIFIVLRYNGINIAYESLVQGAEGADFTGGVAVVTFSTGTPEGYVQDVAAIWGVEATLDTGTTYTLRFDETIPVGRILTLASADLNYQEGSPAWITVPGWWPSSSS